MGPVIRRATMVAGAALVLLGSAAGVASAAGGAEVSQGGSGAIDSVSCTSAGNCSAGGQYIDSSGRQQAFVVSEVHGVWGKAVQVPGSAALNRGGYAQINSVSCASAGNCSAGGVYAPSQTTQQAFVVSQVHGIWGKAIDVPGIGALNQVGIGWIESVSCASAGNCSAGGEYTDSDGGQPFVVSEVHGTWGKATKVPGIAAVNEGGGAQVSVSCASASNCSAGGEWDSFGSSHLTSQPFVVSQVHGTWARARGVRSVVHGSIFSVSCAAVGYCSAGGYYDNSSGAQALAVSQVRGAWGKAVEVPGIAALNRGGFAYISDVSCASPGNCSAGGDYGSGSNFVQAFVVSQVHGIWGKGIEVPGTAALNRGEGAVVNSVSCASAGYCSAGGDYTDSSLTLQVFVVSEVHGRWGKAIEVPGTAGLTRGGGALLVSVSCTSAGNCVAGGSYSGSRVGRAFVVSEVRGIWGRVRAIPAP
jgi:hypothetical protein